MRVLSRPMKFTFRALIVAALFCTANVMLAQNQQPAAEARSLAAAETAFAHESVEKGMRAAFLDALSDDGIVFQPGPLNGKKAWLAEKESSGQLRWQPVLAVVAASGDLGYTTGPWSFKKKAGDEESAFGQFVSIWRRERGRWKLLFDLGTENPKPKGAVRALQLINLSSPTRPTGTRLQLFQRDREYAAAARRNFAAMAADDIRLYRPGGFQAVGKPAAEMLLRSANQPANFSSAKGELSKAGDLGFAWGEYSGSANGYFLRIWRRSEAGEWKLALDLLHHR